MRGIGFGCEGANIIQCLPKCGFVISLARNVCSLKLGVMVKSGVQAVYSSDIPMSGYHLFAIPELNTLDHLGQVVETALPSPVLLCAFT